MTDLHVDFETRSTLDLRDVGVDVYSAHPTTNAILLGWAKDEEPVQVWEVLREQMPEQLRELLNNPEVLVHAWNSIFERYIFKRVLKIDIPITRFRNPQIQARMLSIPADLEDAGIILKLPQEQRKLKEGENLLPLFSLPFKDAQKDTLFGDLPPEFHDWQDKPEEWERFKAYCKRDVETERFIEKAMKAFPVPENELRMWFLDQKINDTGMPVDEKVCTSALKLAQAERDELLSKISEITGCANANSRQQLFAWAQKQGYTFKSLGKVFTTRALAGECELTPQCKEVLQLRQKAAKTSYTKYQTILDKVGSDWLLRDQFSFLGASRTGRWASVGLNLQNMPRPNKAVAGNIHKIVALLRAGDLNALIQEFPTISLMELASGVLRSTFAATSGWKLVVCDLGAIENRVLGWLAGCESILDVFRKGLDPYKDFATSMYGVPYDAVTKEQRQNAKPPVLGCGYRLGGGSDGVDRYGNPIRTGLWGYAKAMGVDLPQEECQRLVRVFREKYPEVVQLWYDYENAAMETMHTKKPIQVGVTTMQAFGGVDFMDRKILRMTLPSGRCLHYIQPRIIEREFFGKMKKVVSYEGRDQFTGMWGRTATNGGKFVENAVQAIARDILVEGLLKADAMGFTIYGHCHDEIIAGVPLDSKIGIAELRACMIATIDWAADLPLDAAGYEDQIYKKE